MSADCSDTGEVWDYRHGIESLLRDSQVIDVPQAPSGPPQKGPGGNGSPEPGMMNKPDNGTSTTGSSTTATASGA